MIPSIFFRQKNEEKQASQKYIRETLTRHPSALQSIDEDQQTRQLSHSWTNLANFPTTYQNSFQNRPPPVRSMSSFETTHTKYDESTDTNPFNENHEQQRPRSASPAKSPQPQISMKRPVFSQQQKQRVDLLQLPDDNNDDQPTPIESEKHVETVLPHIKSGMVEPRHIRELQSRLSRQEGEARKRLNELQSKQSRLENALRLLTKQPSAHGQRRSQNIPDENPSGTTKSLLINQSILLHCRNSTNTIAFWCLETRCFNRSSSSRKLI